MNFLAVPCDPPGSPLAGSWTSTVHLRGATCPHEVDKMRTMPPQLTEWPTLFSSFIIRPLVTAVTALMTVTALIALSPSSGVAATVTAPMQPPASICSNPTPGPASPPAGAITVNPAVDADLSMKTDANPPGTTFWLAPGTHTLGNNEYGQVIPKDGDTYLGAPGAVLDGRGINRYAFTQQAKNVTIRYLTVQGFDANRDEGVVNHDSGDGWVIQDDAIQNNKGAGLMAGAHQQVRNNCIRNNGQYGINAYKSGDTITGLVVDNNEIVGNNTDDWETKVPGCGCTGGAKFWAVNGADITSNWVHDNHGPGLWADTNNNDFLFQNNFIDNNDSEGIFYEISYNALIRDNTFVRNALIYGPKNPGFPTGAIYVSESGGDRRVPARYTSIEIAGNRFMDNWGGVVLWENPDRFCGSPANTSDSYCTLVNPAVANGNTCTPDNINNPPYYSDCRWKTQNVAVHDNDFSFDPNKIGDCAATPSCGVQAMFSAYGTYPSWSPYMGDAIEQAITFHQNNQFTNNTYSGPWKFMAYDQGTFLTLAEWQAAPYNQDPAEAVIPLGSNLLDTNTATIEDSRGVWHRWYSASPIRAAEQAHSGGASLKVTVTANYGWGINANNWPGFTASSGTRTISFWARSGSPGSVNTLVTTTVHWLDQSGRELLSTALISSPLSTDWRQAITTVTAPSGTASAYMEIEGNAGANDYLYLDDFFIG